MKALRTKFHRDGTVTFWSVYLQQWVRQPVGLISDRDLATMNNAERSRIAKAKGQP